MCSARRGSRSAERSDMPIQSDSHAHLTMEAFDPDREQVIERCRAAGLAHVITISSYRGDARRCADLAARHDFIHFAAGLHPHEAKDWSDEVARDLRAAAQSPKAVANGEIGPDYHLHHSTPQDQ